MDEYTRCQWSKEEVFLEEHYETADAALAVIGDRWKPNYRCTDQVRRWRELLMAQGRLDELVNSAVMFYGRRPDGLDGLSSIRIYLRSSTWLFVARVHWPGAEAMVDVLADNEVRRRVRA